MNFAPQSLKSEYGTGFPIKAAMRNLDGWILTFH